ncbi:sigma-70 family RNA polymerase sigma factor [Schleiferilactobacillus shenzhenensis]|nr:sigma-70 family RNA polymerase sigma factor [Schleiferilactobacillus shenzhenensis]
MAPGELWAAGFAAAQEEEKLINGAVKRAGRSFGVFAREDLVQEAMLIFAECYVAEQPVTEQEWAAFRPRVYQKIRWVLGDLRRRENWWQERQASEILAADGAPAAPELTDLCLLLRGASHDVREKAIVEEHWLRDVPLQTVADHLGLSIRTMRNARNKLRRRLLSDDKRPLS